MDKTVPPGAAMLLDFIGSVEVGRADASGYDVIYGHNQRKLVRPVTQMTLGQVLAAQPGWSKAFGSSATGRYQFMNATLKGLKAELGLFDSQIFSADLQDRLGFHLLLRRGYAKFIAGQIDRTEFGKRLAMEWASLPVLKDTQGAHRRVRRGQSYYAGDGVNKSLVLPTRVEEILDSVLLVPIAPETLPKVKEEDEMTSSTTAVVETKPATESKINWLSVAMILSTLATRFGLNLDPQMILDVLTLIGVVGPVAVIALRTWWTKTIVQASLK